MTFFYKDMHMHSVQSSCGRKRLNTLFFAFAALTAMSFSHASQASQAGCDSTEKYKRHDLLVNGKPVLHNGKPIYYFKADEGKVIYCIEKSDSRSDIVNAAQVDKLMEQAKEQSLEGLTVATAAATEASPASQVITPPAPQHAHTSASTTTTTAFLSTSQSTQQPSAALGDQALSSGQTPQPSAAPIIPASIPTPAQHAQTSASTTTTTTALLATSQSTQQVFPQNNPTPTPAQATPTVGSATPAIIPQASKHATYDATTTVIAGSAGLATEYAVRKALGDDEKKALIAGLIATNATSLGMQRVQQDTFTWSTVVTQLAIDNIAYLAFHHGFNFFCPPEKKQKIAEKPVVPALPKTTENRRCPLRLLMPRG